MIGAFHNLLSNSITRVHWVQVIVGIAVLYASAQVCIPLMTVPVTLQPTAIMLLGLCFSRAVAIQTVLSYLVIGALGAPVFAMGMGGLPVLIGPRGGYLLGFLLAVVMMTSVRSWVLNNLRWGGEFALTLLGTACIYACGLAWLSMYLGSVTSAVQVGFLPFIIPGVIKNGLLVAIVRYVRR
jgi:biotin transport system substrate-specific component